MDRSSVTRRVWTLVEPIALAMGLEIVDVQYRSEGGRLVLRILADRPAGGVTLDDLTRLSREAGDVLDAHDPVEGRYHLECSSPGVDRPLVLPRHFERARGERVRVRTRDRVGDRRQFRGVLEAVDAAGITVREEGRSPVAIPFTAIDRANVEYDFTRPMGARRAEA